MISKNRSDRGRHHGFTLVELLVVIAIIVILVALLLPALGRAKEQGNRTACGANLRSVGLIATMFANDHEGLVPGGFSYGQTNGSGFNGVVFPVRLSFNPANDTSTAAIPDWQRYGTSYQLWSTYGPSPSIQVGLYNHDYTPNGTTPLGKMWLCPTRAIERGGLGAITGADYYGSWGWYTQTTYEYVGGTANHVAGWDGITYGSGFNFGATPPAMRLTDSSGSVLATDLVLWQGPFFGNAGYIINHPDPANGLKPAFQNVLYLDGHVDGVNVPQFLDVTTKARSNTPSGQNYAILTDPANPTAPNGYFYWPQQ